MHDFDELETLIDEQLHALPRPPAPRTLLPRTLMAAATTDVRSVPGDWSPTDAWRLSAALALALVVLIATGLAGVRWAAGAQMTPVIEAVAAMAVVMRVLWNALFEPLVTYAILLVLLLAFAASAFWAAVRYVAFDGATHT
jgi:hypothetical protein